MSIFLFLEQILNGIQLGVMLFLISAGLTLVLGIMNLVNLAHGTLYMVGAYLFVTFEQITGSFILAIPLALIGTMLIGMVIEIIVLRLLYRRDHLDQVLATFGLILFFNELVALLWGRLALYAAIPEFLNGHVEIIPNTPYPVFRLTIIVIGIAVALFLYYLIARTRLGMLIRAGASNRVMVGALGINIKIVFTLVFGIGAMLAGLAGIMAAPIRSVIPGMAELGAEPILILTFVVVVIGGMGSVRGAFIAALMVGGVDTIGRAFLPLWFGQFLQPATANTAGPAVASMLVYVLMVAVLYFRPDGLFPSQSG